MLPFPRQTFDSKCPTMSKCTQRQRNCPKGMVTLFCQKIEDTWFFSHSWCFLFTCRSLLFSFAFDNLFCGYEVRLKQLTLVKTIWGGTRLQWRCSGFQVTAIIEGFFSFEIFDSAILLGQEKFGKYFLSRLVVN